MMGIELSSFCVCIAAIDITIGHSSCVEANAENLIICKYVDFEFNNIG